MRIMVVGYSGSGKSTLSEKLGKKYRLPVLYLDQVHWLPGWQEQERVREQVIVQEFLDLHGQWVIDGNYSALHYEQRLALADWIIFMNFNRARCLMRAWRRYVHYRHKTRPSMAGGCPEKMDWEFVRWILHDGRTKARRQGFEKLKRQYGHKVLVIKNQRQLDRLLSGRLASKA